MIHRYNGHMSGICHKLYTAKQVRGIDSAAIDGLGIPGYELMCRAGAAVLGTAFAQFPSAQRWLVLCGPGNNGGDGYVVARLAAEAGIDVTVSSLVDPANLKGDAATAYADWLAASGKVETWPLAADARFDLALDALLGTGIDREVGGVFRQAIAYLNQLDCPTLAIDIPSGLNADTGCAMGCAVRAAGTVTFVGRKRGMYTADGPDYCGPVTFDDLAIPAEAVAEQSARAGRLLSQDVLTTVLTPRPRNSHKGSFGHVLAVGGIEGMSGAIRLCGEAALRSGAGRVTLATAAAHASLVNLGCPELMVKAIGADTTWLADNIADFILAVGPGLGAQAWSRSLLDICLAADTPLVVDADGLNLLAELCAQTAVQRSDWILTPHPGEAARLLDCKVSAVQQDRVHAAVTIAERFNAQVVLKGCGTVVAGPDGAYSICPLGNPGMATAGSGDVLTGILVALLAQGLTCRDAAEAGTLAHAAAGDLAALESGEMALMAGDITDHLAGVWRSAGA